MKMSLSKEQAKQFIELQEAGDILALDFYQNILNQKQGKEDLYEGEACARSFTKEETCEVLIVEAVINLNAVIIQMEQGTIKYNGNIDTAYREIMMELVESARKICEYEV